ncbi:D-ribose pyranase [Phocoenobacter skyensis]|uniref:D-ribose pyranase n=1 Tax=Phocoenobacter skyensis TaxID=97481 RepID=A0A1H7WRC5_9PAST|nr:D-ribose pyranase [Pasteurella skyensis]MDP8079017.1 D-ribose pyranase [Pasteurella skyensis]MDP8084967.1 D-ribose pyranase [Pasteurella skyensis]MDP8185269.1 D-ribose pyranase [Pasteurella skyensis]QLB23451.1 D-ribose pyranase [Pasteurella skyensis]SEM24001.1 D-ribose pyranase [Pasteurella skyensis]
MKKTSLLNAPLSQLIAKMGHTDGITLCDAGLPIPENINRIDLAITKGIPSFLDLFEATITELFVESVLLAEEIKKINPNIHSMILEKLSELEKQQGNQIQIDYISHEQFKQKANESKGIVRSGECSPYANIILYSGVPF